MGRDRTELFLASFLMLFVELVLIRWAGAYVIYLSYFANFILLGSFLGIGVGFLRARREPDLFRFAPALLALFVGVVLVLPVTIDRTGGDLVYFGVQTHGLPTWVMLPFIFLATAAVMAAIAHGVALRFSRLPALDAYRADIIGSVCGIAVFSVLALLGTGPIAWGLVVAVLFVLLLRRPSLVQALALGAMLVVFAAGTFSTGTVWSPYYRLQVSHQGDKTAIDANGIPHQTAIVTTGSDYEDIYARLTRPPGRVLVVGAGNGNDVAVALEHGAQHVDAVEIDPEIQKIGVEFHPQHPYQDPRVTRIIADGRAYLERTHQTYDLIIFALPDSLTLVAGQSAIRLESFLFTLQAFQAAHDRLAPGGVFAIYNFYREQWLADRLAGTMADVFGQRPCLDLGEDHGGSVGQLSIFIDSTDPSALDCATRWDPAGRQVIAPAVDDRPFPYLKGRTIPSRYLLTVALILLASAIVVRAAGGRYRSMRGYLDLFFMGAAFLLLETKSVVQFALLFGTTWFVNALVFGGVLLSVLIAIEIERRSTVDRRRLLFGLLAVGLLVAYLVPTASLLALAPVPRFVAATALAFFPIFAANLIFASRFRDTADPTAAFGANLLGAMFGGTLEYLSLITGYRALLIVVAVLYGLAYVTFRSGGVSTVREEPVPATLEHGSVR
ncbi:MAG TPA: spermidine synthase [Actinomycetota bacterium]|nr:spermidine synthase [Actinomycetota bacterium]